VQTKLFVGGEFVDGVDGATIDVYDPHDGSLLAEVAEARAADVDRAVEAAAKAYEDWRHWPAAERGRLLLKLADRIEEHAEELALLETRDTGHPLRDSRTLDVPRTAATFRYFGGMADKFQGSVVPVERGFLDYVLREPIGVVGQIVPWNFPLMFTRWKMGPALSAGNTVVFKPSELTPLSLLEAIGQHPWRPAHTHLKVAAPGHATLTTMAYYTGDPWLDDDTIHSVKPDLVLDTKQGDDGDWHVNFDVSLPTRQPPFV